MLLTLGNIAIYTLTAVVTAVYWTLGLLPAAALPFLPTPRRRHFMRWLLLGYGKAVIFAAWRPFFRVRYADLSGGVRVPGVIVVNHRAATDGFLVAMAGLNVAQTVNSWPLRLPFFGFGAKLGGYFDITGWDMDAIRAHAAEVIGFGDMVLSFPEGTRSESPRMNPFHSGIFRVAMELGVPVYMLCIAGNEFMPDRKFRFREFREVRMRLLPPIPAEAVRAGADFLVVGRPIAQAADPESAAEAIVEEMAGAAAEC